MTTSHTPSPDRSRLLALGWAVFVACSWTWCIGMYLPVLMVRDYGAAGWIVFAIPNVLGAAALGWVLQRPGAAAGLARRHWPAAAAFSVVTVLFHAFFVGWIIHALVGNAAWMIALSAAIAFYFFGRGGRRDLVAATALFAFSVAAFIVAVAQPEAVVIGSHAARVPSPLDLAWLAPVCIFGFLLCPYLDLTFLRARASTEKLAGIVAFTIGFGILFVVMILFTLWYAPFMQPASIAHLPRTLAWIIAGHMMLQSAFTVALHVRALSEDRRVRKVENIAIFFIAMIIAALVGARPQDILPAGHNTGEFVYRLVMGFYGLIFPAYVLLFMIPGKAGRRALAARTKWVVFAIAMACAGPMFWAGFIEGKMIWLVPGLTVVLLSRGALIAASSRRAKESIQV